MDLAVNLHQGLIIYLVNKKYYKNEIVTCLTQKHQFASNVHNVHELVSIVSSRIIHKTLVLPMKPASK